MEEKHALIARFMGPTWGPSGADRTLVGPMLAPPTLLSGWWYHNFGKGGGSDDLCAQSSCIQQGAGNTIKKTAKNTNENNNPLIKQVVQMRAPLAARCEPAGNQNRPQKVPYVFDSTTICKLVDLILALHQSDCRNPNWVSVKTVHSSSTNHGQTTARFRSFFR